VLAFGPEALAEYSLPMTDYDTARKHIEAQGDWLDY
jgi:hypothetical protein